MNGAKIRSAERLARGVYAKCRDCEGGYKSFTSDVRSIRNVLQDLEDAIDLNPPNATLENDLVKLLDACTGALNELSEAVDKFNDLPLQSQRTWDRLSWGQEDENNLKARLNKLAKDLEVGYKRLRESPTAQIDRALQTLAKEIANGRLETSTQHSYASAAAKPEDNVRWEQIIRDLGDLGVTEEMVREHKDFIVDWIMKAINDGTFVDERSEPGRTPLSPIEEGEATQVRVVPIPPPPNTIASHPVNPVDTLEQEAMTWQSVPSDTLTWESRVSQNGPYQSTPPPFQSSPPPPQTPQTPASPAPPPPPPKNDSKSPMGYGAAASEKGREANYYPAAPESAVPVSAVPSSNSSTPAPRRHSRLGQYSTIPMDQAPPPIDEDPPENVILSNAQRICFHWNGREWKHAREQLQNQIACVERGETVIMHGERQKPDVRILRYLIGISFSLTGEYLKAKNIFEALLAGANLQQLVFDDGDIAIARWLGECCIMLNQVNNAALAWAISYHGLLFKQPPMPAGSNRDKHMLEDLRLLNQKTSGLQALRNAFTKTNRDASTILPNLGASQKFQLVNTVMDVIVGYDSKGYTPRRLPPIMTIAEGFLTQTISGNKTWPLPQDPFFRVDSSIELLSNLSKPYTPINVTSIPTISLGKSKTLIYVTRKPVSWLVECIRYALNSFAVEWKIIHSKEYLLRFSQTHNRIVYYDCFSLQFHKLSFRNLYGFKLNANLYSTRQFGAAANQVDEEAMREKLKTELAGKLKEYVKNAEVDYTNGKWPPKEVPPAPKPPPSPTAVEMDTEMVSRVEIMESEPIQELMSYEIAELPG